MRIKPPAQEFAGINVIPMIDTMMFLLVFFMMATRFADIERDVHVKPPSTHDNRPITAIPQELVVNVTTDGRFLIAGRERRLEEIDSLLKMAVSGDARQAVVIRGDRNSVLQYAVDVLTLCEKHGIERTYLTTRQTGSG